MIKISDVNFSYPKTDKMVLNHININIEIGKNYLICGDNGSGKSTLCKIIAGILPIENGKIEVFPDSNIKLNDIISYIDQKPYIFTDTLENNVNFMSSHMMMQEEYKMNELLNLKERTILSNNSVSSGEAQIIEIMRSLSFKKKLIILDETFSSIDAEKKEKIMKLLMGKEDVSLIVIDHNTSNKDAFDSVWTLKEGKLI